MRILVVAPRVPWPLNQGTAIRNFHIARLLAARHSVTLVAFGDPDATAGPLHEAGVRVVAVPEPPARPFGRRLVDLGTTPTPDLARRLDSPAMTARLADEVRASSETGGFDAVLAEGLEMARHGLSAAARMPGPTPLIYDAHNAEWVLQDRAWRTDARHPRLWHGAIYSLAQTWKLRRFERSLLLRAHTTVAVSRRDADALLALAPGADVHVVPNGVDAEHVRCADPAAVDAVECVFVGKMDFRPNIDAMVWFCRRVWPAVLARRPEARLSIVGRDPVPRVRELADETITVTGDVPDVQPFLRVAGVVVVPLRVGGGTRLKVLEAMAAGKAIAATTLAVEGVDVAHGREVLLADTPDNLASTVVRLMSDDRLRADLGARARATALSAYDWRTLVPRIERLLETSVAG